jgi:hypothetical protein
VFDLPTLLATPLPDRRSTSCSCCCSLGFGVKVPLVPLHTWLPAMAMGAPAAVTALLVGLKLGAYGLIRFAIPLAPIAARDLHWLLAGFGTVAILYGGVAALAQSNLRRVLAYSSLAHVGLVLLGLASFSVSALQGALLQLLNFSLAAGGGFLALSFLQRRTASTDISQLGGLLRSMPRALRLLPALRPGRHRPAGDQRLPRRAADHRRRAAQPYRRRPRRAVRHGARRRRLPVAVPAGLSRPTRNPDVAAADDLLPREAGGAAAASPPDSGGWRLSAADPRTDPARRRGLGGGAGGGSKTSVTADQRWLPLYRTMGRTGGKRPSARTSPRLIRSW